MLSELLAPLDYPRQALANLGRSAYRGLSGEGSWEDVLSALPGALGVAGGAALGGPLGAILTGSLIGGAAQGLGRLSGHRAFEAPTTGELVGQLGGDPESTVHTMGLGLATDPLSYAGAGSLRGLSTTGLRRGAVALDPAVALERGIVGRTGEALTHVPAQPAWARAALPEVAAAAEPYAPFQVGEHLASRSAAEEALARSLAPTPGRQEAMAAELAARRAAPPAPLGISLEATPAEYERQLAGRYGILSDFEKDVAGLPQTSAVLGTRANLWEDLLAAEQGFHHRRQLKQWTPPDLNLRNWERWLESLPPESPAAQWLGEPLRQFTPQQLNLIGARYATAYPESQLVRILAGGPSDLEALIKQNLQGAHAPNVPLPHSGIESLVADVARGEGGQQIYGIGNAAWATGPAAPLATIENLRAAGAADPRVSAAIEQLQRLGYPIDREMIQRWFADPSHWLH